MMKKDSDRKITIDPGSNGTGFVVWSDEWKILSHGNIYGKDKIWIEVCNQIVSKVKVICKHWDVKEMYIEFPQFFPSVGGTMVASHGSLVKLAWIAGTIAGSFHPGYVEPVEVLRWKGQLPKKLVENRIKDIIGRKNLIGVKSHTFDAIGIGLYKKGVF